MLSELFFITGNHNKAEQLGRFLDYPIQHTRIALQELQSLSLTVIAEHKVRQAYALVGKPVLVEDVSLEFDALNGLPGPFIKFFVEAMSLTTICSLLEGKSRNATAKGVFAYFDGTEIAFFEGALAGTIAESPRGENGYGWDALFIPEGYTQTRSEMSPEDYQATFEKLRPIHALKAFLEKRRE